MEVFNGISFIIPAYNEEAFIGKVISNIIEKMDVANLSYEILVVDNGSLDETVSIAEKFVCDIYKITRSRVSYARNFGARQAKYDLFAFIDGDTLITESWVNELNSFICRFGCDSEVVTGASVSIPENPTWIELSWFNSTSKNYIGGANILCSRKLFFNVDGFDESLETGEDYDFCRRVKYSGYVLEINKSFKAIHLGYPKNLTGFCKREIWHGKGDCRNLSTFVNSKVSLVSLLYFLLAFLSFTFFCFNLIDTSVLMLSVLFFLNFSLTFFRFGNLSTKAFFYNSLLNMLYFFSRFLSIFSVLRQKYLKTTF